jgi:hypothetical protein
MGRVVWGAVIASATAVLGFACFTTTVRDDAGVAGPEAGQACIEAGGHCTQGLLGNPCPLCDNQLDAESASCPSVAGTGGTLERQYCCTPADCGSIQPPDGGD